jgi:ABC-2 type transport system ATP-binding protein
MELGAKAKRAVEGISSLAIPRGSFFGLLGPNGAGKSTTIHCITGIAQPTAGTVTIDVAPMWCKTTSWRARRSGSRHRNLMSISFRPPSSSWTTWVGTMVSRTTSAGQRINESHRSIWTRGAPAREVPEAVGRAQASGDARSRPRAYARNSSFSMSRRRGSMSSSGATSGRTCKELNAAGTTIILTSHYLEENDSSSATTSPSSITAVSFGNGTKADFMAGGKSVEEKYLELLKK